MDSEEGRGSMPLSQEQTQLKFHVAGQLVWMRDSKEGGLSEGRARGIQWLKVVPEDPQGGMLNDSPRLSSGVSASATGRGILEAQRPGKLVLPKNEK